LESVCWGNSTVGSNPTLSAIPILPCILLHSRLLATSVLPFFIIYWGRCPAWPASTQGSKAPRDGSIKGIEKAAQAAAQGLTVAEYQDQTNAGRTPIKVAIERFLKLHRNDRPNAVKQYNLALTHLLAHLPRGVRFIKDLPTSDALDTYVQTLQTEEYAAKTIATRMGVIFSIWVFVNKDGEAEGHFLRKFKAIAKRAGLNCGNFKTTIQQGKYHMRKPMEVTWGSTIRRFDTCRSGYFDWARNDRCY
jgi:hypothetical protein